MRYLLTDDFEYTFDRKQVVLSKGKVLELTPEQAARFGDKVRLSDEPSPADIQTTTFEPTGDPVSCPFWLQVCWAVGMYQEQCTRNAGCRVYRFLEKQRERTLPL
jgi:hypothetical protein